MTLSFKNNRNTSQPVALVQSDKKSPKDQYD